MIKAVLFDVDGVLIDSFEANLKFYQYLLVKNGYTPPTRETFSKIFHMTMFDVIRVLTDSPDEKEIKRIWQMGRDRGVRYPNELLSTPDGYDSVLNKLKKEYSLGIVISRVHGSVFSLPQLAKYKDDFKTVVYYDDTQKHKPDPEPLSLVLKRLDIKSHEAVYIGDARSDIDAARGAGMKVIIYSKSNLEGADINTSEFKKLPELIKTFTDSNHLKMHNKIL